MSVPDREESSRIAAARHGDAVAFADLIADEYPIAFRLAHALLRDRGEAEDAVQEAALKAWRHIGQLREDAPFRPWWLGIVANQCRTSTRRPWWSVIRSSDIRAEPGLPSDELSSIALRNALRRLPHDQRLILILRFYLDLPYDEIAAQFGISPKAARTRTERALHRLRPLLRLQEVTA